MRELTPSNNPETQSIMLKLRRISPPLALSLVSLREPCSRCRHHRHPPYFPCMAQTQPRSFLLPSSVEIQLVRKIIPLETSRLLVMFISEGAQAPVYSAQHPATGRISPSRLVSFTLIPFLGWNISPIPKFPSFFSSIPLMRRYLFISCVLSPTGGRYR